MDRQHIEMGQFNLTDCFHDEDAARDLLEQLRWPDGPECPHCGTKEEHYRLRARPQSRRPVRKGVWKCKHCRKQFTVTVGTILHRTHIPLNKWVHVIHLMCSREDGVSAHEIHQKLGVTYRTAWALCRRVRAAMRELPLAKVLAEKRKEAEKDRVGKRRPRKP